MQQRVSKGKRWGSAWVCRMGRECSTRCGGGCRCRRQCAVRCACCEKVGGWVQEEGGTGEINEEAEALIVTQVSEGGGQKE